MNNEQISLILDQDIAFPQSDNDIQNIWNTYIHEEKDDSDAFSVESVSKGYSYFIYGTKSFELVQNKSGCSLRLPGIIMSSLFPERQNLDDEKFYSINSLQTEQMKALLALLKDDKHKLFRELITESFGCCNDFIKCSDAKHCIHEDDRFFNGCYYRENLEAGRIFYGKNKNI